MAFLNKAGLQNLTNKLVQGDTIKVVSSKGTTVKEVIDNIKRECESIALSNVIQIKNKVNQFVVGKGINMDISTSIKEGVSQIAFQGVTYQNLITFSQNYTEGDYPFMSFKRHVNLKPNTTYTFITPSFKDYEVSMYIGFNDHIDNKLLGYQNSNIGTFTTKSNLTNVGSKICFYYKGKDKKEFIRACSKTHMILEGDYTQLSTAELPKHFEGIQNSFENNIVNLSMQSKTEDAANYKYKVDIQYPLRSLPNGVCDEIKNGQLIRRCGEIIINEDTVMQLSETNSKYEHVTRIWIKSNNISNLKQYSKSFFSTISQGLSNTNLSMEITNGFDIHFPINTTGGDTIEHVKKWLKNNPIKVIYELENPTVTEIKPISFNVSQKAIIKIDSYIAPITTHSIILNRATQIEQGIDLIASLRNKIDKLEKAYDSNLIATQYRLDNLKLNYKLEREEE